jgi:hypothetical protein
VATGQEGKSYKAFTDRMQVETPIERDGDALVMRGCMAHQCTIEEEILMIDLADGTPYVALKFNRKVGNLRRRRVSNSRGIDASDGRAAVSLFLFPRFRQAAQKIARVKQSYEVIKLDLKWKFHYSLPTSHLTSRIQASITT